LLNLGLNTVLSTSIL